MEFFGAAHFDTQSERQKHIELRSIMNRKVEISPPLSQNPELVVVYTKRQGPFTIDDVSDDYVTIRAAANVAVTFPLSQVKIDRT
jgi:hypothetical protein